MAADLRHNRQVAIKVVTIDPRTEEPELRFLREIRLLANLQHPNILPLHDSGHVGGLLYYVMPYVRGQSLREKISKERRLAISEAVMLTLEIADALHHAHRAGVIHRDIKPENILISGGHAIIADFGVAGLMAPTAGGRLTSPERGTPGTPSYMSPEQLIGSSEPDARSDVYSLTCVLYEMLTGKPPFAGKQGFVQRFMEPPLISRARPDVPPPLERAIARGLEKNPDDRFSDARQFADALRSALAGAEHASVPPVALGAPKRRAAWRVVAIPVVAAAAIAAVIASVRSRSAEAPSRYLVAVAPFTVLDSSLALWREGLMDVLSRNIDGAGPLRSVPASVVTRSWGGSGDAASALQLAGQTGAGTVVFGHLLKSGQDSVRVITSVFDAENKRVVAQIENGNAIDRMDRVSDSLTFDLIRELDAALSIGAARQTRLRVPVSLEALRAFLQGEQFFRRSYWDSARVYYERVVARDSTFALAYRRLGLILAWLRGASDPEALTARLRAGALNHGLGPRDSVLLLADSLAAAAVATPTLLEEWPLTRRLFATLEHGVRRYPRDAEMWFELGEARFHFGTGPVRNQSWRATLDAFDQAIALDSGLSPAYAHTPEVALEVAGAPLALQYVKASLRQDPGGRDYDKMRLLALVLGGETLRSLEVRAILDRISADVAHSARQSLQRWPDTAETAVELSRLLLGKKFSPLTSLTSDDVYLRDHLAGQLALRGHIREAAANVPSSRSGLVFELAYVGGGEPVESRVNELVRAGARFSILAPYGWASRGDTAALHAYLDRARHHAKSPDDAVKRLQATYDTSAAIAYLSLARNDTTRALARFVALPDTLCLACYPDRFARARLHARSGNYRSAMNDLSERPTRPQTSLLVLIALERAKVAERLGDPASAARDYQFVVDAWAKADAHLQVHVREARAGLQRLRR